MNKLDKNVILVTGGCGFIASHLVDKLIQNDNYVINIDKLDYCSNNNTTNIEDSYKFIQGNVCNKELVTFILNEYKPTIIFHLAAQTHVDNSFYNSVTFTYDNIIGTHNLLECVKEYNEKNNNHITKFIHMSTDEVYGEVKEGGTECTEKSLLKPTNPYSATKASAELLANSYYISFGLPVVIIRCNNVFGPRQYPEKVIPSFIYNLLNGDKCYIHGKGNTERHFIFVDNVIYALLLIRDKGEIGEIYNISNSEFININDLAKLLIKKLKNDENYSNYIQYIDDRNFNDFRYLINSSKLEKLGWKPEIDFKEGLERTIQSFKQVK